MFAVYDKLNKVYSTGSGNKDFDIDNPKLFIAESKARSHLKRVINMLSSTWHMKRELVIVEIKVSIKQETSKSYVTHFSPPIHITPKI